MSRRIEADRIAWEQAQQLRRIADALEAIVEQFKKPIGMIVPDNGASLKPQRVQVTTDEHDAEPPMRPPVEPMGPGD